MENFKEKTNQLIIKQYLPHNFLAEKIILSTLLVSSEAIDISLRNLTSKTFYFINHQEIYRAILYMYKNKLAIDYVSLYEFIKENGLLEKVGGIKVLNEILIQVPNLVYFEEYIKLIQDKFLRRCLIKLGYKIINSSYITNIPLQLILNNLDLQLFNLKKNTKNQKFTTSAELLSKVFVDLKNKSLKPTFSGLASGYYDLDCLTQGFQKSDLIIIAGRPSMGKTALALNIVLNVTKSSKLPVLFFSLEMSKEQLIYRLLTIETHINNFQLRSGWLTKTNWKKLKNSIKSLSKLPFLIDDKSDLEIHDIRSKIKKVIFDQNQIGLIIIDYLQLMYDSKNKIENRNQELSQITRSLKKIAREFNVPVIALSQLSRNVENRLNKRPVLSDLRESGTIEQDADLVLMLYRDNYYKNSNIINNDTIINQAELLITKQRNGPTGKLNLKFNSKINKFLNDYDSY
jgi:replicative DNA helicase